MSFAENLKKYRENAPGHPSAKAFARDLGINYTTYLTYEDKAEPRYEKLIEIANKLGVSLDELVGNTDASFYKYKALYARCSYMVERLASGQVRVYRTGITTAEARQPGNDFTYENMEQFIAEAEKAYNSFLDNNRNNLAAAIQLELML